MNIFISSVQQEFKEERAAGLPEPEFTLTDGFVATLWRPVREPARSQKQSVGKTLPVDERLKLTDPVADPVADPVTNPVTNPVTDPVTDPVHRLNEKGRKALERLEKEG